MSDAVEKARLAARDIAVRDHPFDGTEPDWVVSARRKTEEAFMAGFDLAVAEMQPETERR